MKSLQAYLDVLVGQPFERGSYVPLMMVKIILRRALICISYTDGVDDIRTVRAEEFLARGRMFCLRYSPWMAEQVKLIDQLAEALLCQGRGLTPELEKDVQEFLAELKLLYEEEPQAEGGALRGGA